MKSMRIYTVHINAKKPLPAAIEDVVIVKEGFAVWAFLFHFLWLIYKRAWLPAALVFLALSALGFLYQEKMISMEQDFVLQLGLLVYVGFSAHDWLRKRLERKGYTFAGVVTARDEVEAYQRFFDRYIQPSPSLSGMVTV